MGLSAFSLSPLTWCKVGRVRAGRLWIILDQLREGLEAGAGELRATTLKGEIEGEFLVLVDLRVFT